MINRVAYKFRSLPEGIGESEVVSYLESQSDYGALTLYANADTGTISLTIPRAYAYIYKDYFIEVVPINQQLIINCHKITPGLLTQKYADLREKLSTLNMYIGDFAKELNLCEYNTRHAVKLTMTARCNALKRELKTELKAVGIDLKPGSPISKLLRQDYLPET